MRCVRCVHSLYKLTATANKPTKTTHGHTITTVVAHHHRQQQHKMRSVQKMNIFVAYPFKLVHYMCTHSLVQQSGMNGEYLFVVNIFYVFDVVVNFFLSFFSSSVVCLPALQCCNILWNDYVFVFFFTLYIYVAITVSLSIFFSCVRSALENRLLANDLYMEVYYWLIKKWNATKFGMRNAAAVV